MRDKEYLEAVYNQFILKRLIIKKGSDLSEAHVSKSDSNMEFAGFLLDNNKFIDVRNACILRISEHPKNPTNKREGFFGWAVVGLYYSAYHAALSLVSKKGYSSKEHNATLCFIIKNFSEFSIEEINLIDELQIKREEIEFYSGLKEERNKASYSTSLIFNKDKVYELREKSILLINKIKSILER